MSQNIVTLPVIRIERHADDADEFTQAAENLVSDYVDDCGPIPDSDKLKSRIAEAFIRARQGRPIYG